MGCGTEVVCVPCRKRWYCGYGSYGRIYERAAKSPLAECEAQGHETHVISEDFTHEENGNLMMENQFDSTVLVEGYSQFDYIDLTAESPSQSAGPTAAAARALPGAPPESI